MLDSCFSQVEFAGVLAGTEHTAAARKLVDFMLSERFQADMPLQMFVFPVRDGTPLPPVFSKFAEVPEQPLSLPAADISAHRDTWIEQWTDTVLR
jgi:thiamine transport system substrate-binding protein